MSVPKGKAAAALLAAVLVCAAPADAVGLGPLRAEGGTDGPTKGFWLNVINPYPMATRFRLSGIDAVDETRDDRVWVWPDTPMVAAGGQRRVLAVVEGLVPGERHEFRVCGERADARQEEVIRARVCSRLSAKRLP